MARTPIGEMLLAQGRIDAVQLRSALDYQQQWGGRLGHALVTLGFLSEADLLRAVALQLGVPFMEIGDRYVPPEVLRAIPEKLIRQRRAFPLALLSEARRGPILVALSEPANLAFLDELSFAAGRLVKPVLASEGDIDRAIARHLGGDAPALAGETRQAIELADDGTEERMDLVERPHTPRTYH